MRKIGANIFKRALAVIIDHLIINLILIVLYFQFFTDNPAEINLKLDIYYLFLFLNFLYFFLSECAFGKTIGKKIFNLKVILINDKPLHWTQALIRNLLRPIDFIGFYLLGFIFVALSNKSQRLGDLLAGTIIVENV